MKGKHTSLEKELRNNVLWVEQIDEVSKVVLGFANACRHKYPPGHIRYKMDVDGGIKVNGYSGNGVLDMFIKIDPIEAREKIKATLNNRFKV